jgi:hypothetical protein
MAQKRLPMNQFLTTWMHCLIDEALHNQMAPPRLMRAPWPFDAADND